MTYDGAVERQVLDPQQLEPRLVRAPRGVRYSRRRMAAESYRSPLARFLGMSLTAHALILAAGLIGGAAYVRRAGVEHPPAVFSFPIDTRPEATASVVDPSAEPLREVEREAQVTEVEVSPTASTLTDEAQVQAPWDALASVAKRSSASDSNSLERVIGDPRTSWRLPSNAASGLHIGHVHEPPVSDCCGEPQPAPQSPATSEIYVYPEVVSMAQAKFPLKSQRLGEDGSVLLEMTVGVDGRVKEVRIAQSSGFSRIDNCAVAAAWDWIFKPAMRDGVPEEALARHRYTFRLTGAGG